MKAPVKKPKAPTKAVTKAVKPLKKAVAPLRAPLSSGPKPAAKAAAKSAAKSAAKPVVKPVVKASVKASGKPTGKPTGKTPSPVTTRKLLPSGQAGAKQAVPKSAAKTPASKPVTQPVTPGGKANLGTPPAANALTLPKSTGKPVAKAPLKPIPSAVIDKKAAPSPVSTTASFPVAAPSTGGLLPRPPLKPGRRSSARTAAHMPPSAPMLPTHAPDAAKATYSAVVERVISPPPHVAGKKDPKLANNWKTKSAEELSDDEVKAMPDAEYMNDKQLAFFRHKLSLLKRDIHNSAGETTEHLREDTVVVPDPADRATIEEEHALELRTRDRERKLLKKIEQSIARIDSGDYGYCDETGEPIGVGRLIARPTASLSLEAQQRRELKQKMFGD